MGHRAVRLLLFETSHKAAYNCNKTSRRIRNRMPNFAAKKIKFRQTKNLNEHTDKEKEAAPERVEYS